MRANNSGKLSSSRFLSWHPINNKLRVNMKIHLFWMVLGLVTLASDLRAEEAIIPRFEIQRFRLEGNTTLSPGQASALLAPYTGKSRDFGDIQMAIEALERSYHALGFTLVTVILPEQEITKGEVLLRVIEPRIKEVSVEGNKHYSRENILASLPTLKIDEPPLVTQISENFRVANESPTRKLALRFSALEKPEELQASVQVTDQTPWKISLSGDNTGNSQSGYYRMGVTLLHANLFDLDHVATIQYTTSPDHAEKVMSLSASYRIPLYRLGDTIDFFGAYSDIDSGTSQISGTDLTISGKGIVSGLRYNMNLPRSGAYEQKLIMGMDYRRYDNTVLFLGEDHAPDVVAHPFNISYNGSYQNDLLSLDFNGTVIHNEPWGGQGQQSDFTTVKNGAAADYWIFRYGFNSTFKLPRDWMIRVNGTGQFTPDRLISGEQFGLGGSSSVRGYEEREESWDGGFSGSTELYSPDIAGLLYLPKSQLRLIGFFDGGTGYNMRIQPGESDANALTSIGTGFRLGVGDNFSFSLDWGLALDSSAKTRSGGSAIHFRGQISY
jgi:hemolysin activation/secretion protein